MNIFIYHQLTMNSRDNCISYVISVYIMLTGYVHITSGQVKKAQSAAAYS